MQWPSTLGVLCLSSLLAGQFCAAANGQDASGGRTAASGLDSSDVGTVTFNFANEDWLPVLQWFADAADKNLDWQALPEDRLNLITQRDYSITEAFDVLNLHLLTRGFTLLSRGDVLFLVKLDENLNPALIPRVAPEELDERGRYEYCKTSFVLDWMLAETAVEELKPMLSPYGQITPLSATNRVEVMDAVVNLREVRELLEREQSDTSEERLVEEFVLEHARALEVLEKVHQILGLETPVSRMTRDQMRMAEEQFEFKAEMLKRLGDKASIKQNDEVYLIANERRNSILANAPPDKIAIIKQTVQALDVPSGKALDLSEVTTMKVYPLNGAEADAVVDILEELRDIGKLHPSARFSEDDDRQILFAYASIQDHLTIESVMEQLAGSARTFKVIPLRRLRAAYVADSIGALMGGQEASDDGDRRDRWSRRGSSDNNWRGFRVEADTPNNRLFLFATSAELKQVEELLVKIGERPEELAAHRDQRVRVIDTSRETADEAIEQLRALWPSVRTNPLRIDAPQPRNTIEGPSTRREDFQRDAQDDASTFPTHETRVADVPSDAAWESRGAATADYDQHLAFTSLLQAVGQPTNHDSSDEAAFDDSAARQAQSLDEAFDPSVPEPPITVRQSASGQLILSSEDTAALDEMEYLLRELLPEQRPFTVFRLRHASPYSMQITLESIFASDMVRTTTPVTFVSDSVTQSIMVFGAGSRELREIEELIRFYDQPAPRDPETVREPRFFDLKYAQAESVAAVLKEIYRDLLSANDKALAQNRENRRAEAIPPPIITTGGNEPRYAGMLSIGVFPQTNSLIVSAPAFLADEIAETIERLDSPMAPTVTRVVVLDGGVNADTVAERLANLVAPRTEPEPENGQRRERGDDRDDRDRDDRDDGDRNERRQENDRRQEVDFRTGGRAGDSGPLAVPPPR